MKKLLYVFASLLIVATACEKKHELALDEIVRVDHIVADLVVAQDTGAAIKGGIRADYFFGHGERAFQDAGRMNTTGSYYLLLPD